MSGKPGFNEPPPPYAPSAPTQPLPGYGNPPSTIAPNVVLPNIQAAPTVIVNVTQFGPYSMQMTCPSCHSTITTETLTSPGLLTWILSGTLLLMGCWLGCCLVPCCMRSCQDIEHRCPNCKAHLGIYKRIWTIKLLHSWSTMFQAPFLTNIAEKVSSLLTLRDQKWTLIKRKTNNSGLFTWCLSLGNNSRLAKKPATSNWNAQTNQTHLFQGQIVSFLVAKRCNNSHSTAPGDWSARQ